MDVSPEEVERVRREGRRRRRLRRVERHRTELAPVVDTGMLSDEDVETLWGVFTGARDEPIDLPSRDNG